MVNFANLKATAQVLIEGNGRTITVSRRDTTISDPTKPWRGAPVPGADTTVSVKAVVLAFDDALVDGTLVKRGDKKALISVQSVEDATSGTAPDLKSFDTFVDGAEDWEIMSVNEVDPGDTSVMYTLQIRK
jgi:hypothetical protein